MLAKQFMSVDTWNSAHGEANAQTGTPASHGAFVVSVLGLNEPGLGGVPKFLHAIATPVVTV